MTHWMGVSVRRHVNFKSTIFVGGANCKKNYNVIDVIITAHDYCQKTELNFGFVLNTSFVDYIKKLD